MFLNFDISECNQVRRHAFANSVCRLYKNVEQSLKDEAVKGQKVRRKTREVAIQ